MLNENIADLHLYLLGATLDVPIQEQEFVRVSSSRCWSRKECLQCHLRWLV